MNREQINGSKLGFLFWIIGLLYASIVMVIIGVDLEDENNPFGINHEKYWLFEAIMIPSFLLITMIILRRHFNSNSYSDKELLSFGFIIMILQYLLDLIVLVFLLGNGLQYFIGLVTIMYLLIPVYIRYLGKKYMLNEIS